MTQYTRSAIPGRAPVEDRPLDGELDRMVFGRAQAQRAVSEPDAPAPRVSRRAEPMLDDDAPPEHLFTERAPRERRKAAPRRKADYAPLPDDAGSRASESKRGPLILFVTLIVIGVFGAVVWNAYSSGLRAPDGGPTPELASAGPFKSRPAVDASKPADIDASVFERVAASKKAPEPATTSEVRPDPTPEPALEVKPEPRIETPKPEPVKLEAPKPAPVKADPALGAPIKLTPAPPPAKATTQAAAVTPPKPTPVAVAAPTPAAAVKSAKLAATTTDGAVPAPPVLDGGAAFRPAFAATGAYVVQLAAPSTEEAAQAEWARRTKAAPGLLGGAEKMVIQADVNGKTVYRLRAGSFATSGDADAFCGAIKASGGACYIAKK